MTKVVLVPIDLEQPACLDIIFPAAIDAARHRKASLRLLTVLPKLPVGMFPYVPRGAMDDAKTNAQQHLDELAKQRVPDDVDWEAVADVGTVPQTIVAQAQHSHADLIVVASHDPKTVDLFLGSVADRVVRRAHCSVLVVREPDDNVGR